MSKVDRKKLLESKFEDLTPEEQSQLVELLLAEKSDYDTKLQLGSDNYQTLLGQLEAEKEAHKTSVANSLTVIDQLKKQNELKDELVKAGSKLSVKHKNKSYTIEINSFKLDGEVYTAKDLQEKPEVVEKLLKLGSGVLKINE